MQANPSLFVNRNPSTPHTVETVHSELQWDAKDKDMIHRLECFPVLGFDVEWVSSGRFKHYRADPDHFESNMFDTVVDQHEATLNKQENAQEGKVSLIQLSCVDGYTVLIRSCFFKQPLPSSLVTILQDRNILKVGVGIDEDAEKLMRDWSVFMQGTVDLRNILCLFPEFQNFSYQQTNLKALGEHMFRRMGVRLLPQNGARSNLVATSNWNAFKLSRDQIDYAARDSQIAVDIFACGMQSLLSSAFATEDPTESKNIRKVMGIIQPYLDQPFLTRKGRRRRGLLRNDPIRFLEDGSGADSEDEESLDVDANQDFFDNHVSFGWKGAHPYASHPNALPPWLTPDCPVACLDSDDYLGFPTPILLSFDQRQIDYLICNADGRVSAQSENDDIHLELKFGRGGRNRVQDSKLLSRKSWPSPAESCGDKISQNSGTCTVCNRLTAPQCLMRTSVVPVTIRSYYQSYPLLCQDECQCNLVSVCVRCLPDLCQWRVDVLRNMLPQSPDVARADQRWFSAECRGSLRYYCLSEHGKQRIQNAKARLHFCPKGSEHLNDDFLRKMLHGTDVRCSESAQNAEDVAAKLESLSLETFAHLADDVQECLPLMVWKECLRRNFGDARKAAFCLEDAFRSSFPVCMLPNESRHGTNLLRGPHHCLEENLARFEKATLATLVGELVDDVEEPNCGVDSGNIAQQQVSAKEDQTGSDTMPHLWLVDAENLAALDSSFEEDDLFGDLEPGCVSELDTESIMSDAFSWCHPFNLSCRSRHTTASSTRPQSIKGDAHDVTAAGDLRKMDAHSEVQKCASPSSNYGPSRHIQHGRPGPLAPISKGAGVHCNRIKSRQLNNHSAVDNSNSRLDTAGEQRISQSYGNRSEEPSSTRLTPEIKPLIIMLDDSDDSDLDEPVASTATVGQQAYTPNFSRESPTVSPDQLQSTGDVTEAEATPASATVKLPDVPSAPCTTTATTGSVVQQLFQQRQAQSTVPSNTMAFLTGAAAAASSDQVPLASTLSASLANCTPAMLPAGFHLLTNDSLMLNHHHNQMVVNAAAAASADHAGLRASLAAAFYSVPPPPTPPHTVLINNVLYVPATSPYALGAHSDQSMPAFVPMASASPPPLSAAQYAKMQQNLLRMLLSGELTLQGKPPSQPDLFRCFTEAMGLSPMASSTAAGTGMYPPQQQQQGYYGAPGGDLDTPDAFDVADFRDGSSCFGTSSIPPDPDVFSVASTVVTGQSSSFAGSCSNVSARGGDSSEDKAISRDPAAFQDADDDDDEFPCSSGAHVVNNLTFLGAAEQHKTGLPCEPFSSAAAEYDCGQEGLLRTQGCVPQREVVAQSGWDSFASAPSSDGASSSGRTRRESATQSRVSGIGRSRAVPDACRMEGERVQPKSRRGKGRGQSFLCIYDEQLGPG